MKKCLSLAILLWCGVFAMAQPLGNEWIDYSKSYYKFKIGSTGLYRINQATLVTAGLGNVKAEEFQLWRNGVQVPLRTSITTGLLQTGDYIEFWGQMNDGKFDKLLYLNSADQLSDKLSIVTDTASFYLTAHKIASQNLRYSLTPNNVAANTLPAETFFNHSLRFNFNDQINRGNYLAYSESIYLSDYDRGEILCSKNVTIGSGKLDVNLGNLYLYNNTGSATLTTAFCGANAIQNRDVLVQLNGNTFIAKNINVVTAATVSANIANSNFGSVNDVLSFVIHPKSLDSAYDRVVVSYAELNYQRQFNFDNKTNFEFSLNASSSGKYLRITNFNKGNALPILLDATNLQYFVADTSTTGVLQFALPATTATTNYILVSQSAINVKQINNLVKRDFINYTNSTTQGNYLIISNQLLMTGSNPVEQYRQYRSSASGGNYNAKIYDIEELVDQFAYGIKKHPLSVRNFLRFAKLNFATQPQNILLIGKAVTTDNYYALQKTTTGVETQNLVPTFGWPASDALMLSPDNSIPAPICAFGRLSAITPQEVTDYLDKVKLYESQATSTTQTIANKLWMKNALHVAGADDVPSANLFTYYLNGYERIYRDTNTCGNVALLSKTSGSAISTTQTDITHLFENGVGLLTYFGHSGATGFAYNLNDPNVYNNYGKYPVFLVNGCSAGNFFEFDSGRYVKPTSLAEKFVFIPNKGSIAFIAMTHFGFTGQLDLYSTGFYNSFCKADYGKTIGTNMMGALQYLKSTTNNLNDPISRNHGTQFVLHGDPAIKIYSEAKPDFAVEDPQVSINPTFISIINNSFTVKANIYNLGKGTGDSVSLLVKRHYPNGLDSILMHKKIASIKYVDSSINLTIPIVPATDKGTNSITITIDDDNKYAELSELNNTITKEFVIFEDDIKPIYPYNYSIINLQNIKLSASTANAFATQKQYIMELDTTTLFNSSFKITKTVLAAGGLIEFDPSITFTDSIVYYWRVAPVPASGSNYHWSVSSFVYLKNATTAGFNQSHFYQHCNSALNSLIADSASRQFIFPTINNTITVHNSVYDYNLQTDVIINDAANTDIWGYCWRDQNLTFNVFNPSNLKALFNCNIGQQGKYGSQAYPNDCASGKEYDFSFETNTPADRKKIMDFMDNIIPTNNYVVVRSIILDKVWSNPTFAATWQADTSIYGSGNSLYHRLKNAGFFDVDSFNKVRSFAFIYQKNNVQFTPVSKFSKDSSDVVTLKVNVTTKPTVGTMVSPKFGPATKWYNMLWAGNRNDLQDIVELKLLGIKPDETVDTLFTYSEVQTNNDISSVSATNYPYLKIYMQVKDTVNLTAYQLKYWRLLADVLPEGAIIPSGFVFKDTFQSGEMQNVAIAFKNISNTAYSDSLSVNVSITNSSNVKQNIIVPKLKPLAPGSSDSIKTTINTAQYNGKNIFYVNVNSNNTPAEQTLTNNFAFKNFVVTGDIINPILDVTFDGVHIFNGDIVSSKPTIHIGLKDESKFLLLNDTANIKLQLQFPDGTTRQFKYDNDTLKFIAATSTTDNKAMALFTPTLLDDGVYELFVQAKDKSQNAAGPQQYRVKFVVSNKPAISNVFNYPNPFTTSTAFVFTLTGSQIPNNLRIQILTITGKIVKEITKAELGNIHIGTNITDYKWDGTDMYGQALGNGVYLYRVITSLDGKALDKFNVKNDYINGDEINTDSYFKAGYGKMYLMR